jgi:hypothetical protein
MPRAMCIIGTVVALLVVLLFGLDLFAAIPFKKVSVLMDAMMMVAGLMLAFASWQAMREQT